MMHNISVDEMRRLILDVRPVFPAAEGDESDGEQEEAKREEKDVLPVPRKFGRVRRLPTSLALYVSQ